MRWDNVLLSRSESAAVIDEVDAWCRRTGTNYNRLVTAAGVNVSTRSSVRHRRRRLTTFVAAKLRNAMAEHRFGIDRKDHKRRLLTIRERLVASGPDPQQRRVNRDPCPRCGVRADVGCPHVLSAEQAWGSAAG